MHVFVQDLEVPSQRVDEVVDKFGFESLFFISDSVIDFVNQVLLKRSGISFREIIEIHTSAVAFSYEKY